MNLGFISDLHLSETDTSLTNAFVDFLKSHSSNLDQLYILGDLPEYRVDPNWRSVILGNQQKH